jgi:hypothetical protein
MRGLDDVRGEIKKLVRGREQVLFDLLVEHHTIAYNEALYEAIEAFGRELNIAERLPDTGAMAMNWGMTILRGLVREE